MDDDNVDNEVSGAGYSARVRLRSSICYMGRIVLRFQMGHGSDVSWTVRVTYSIAVRHEGCRYSWYWSVQKVRVRNSVQCTGRCMGAKGSWLELGSGSEVTVNTRFCLSIRICWF